MYLGYLTYKDKCKCILNAYMAYDEYLPTYEIYDLNGDECYCEWCGQVPLPQSLGEHPCAGLCRCGKNVVGCDCVNTNS